MDGIVNRHLSSMLNINAAVSQPTDMYKIKMNGRWRRFYVSDEITTKVGLSYSTRKEGFDGVYISTRNNPDRICESLEELQSLHTWPRIYLIPSNNTDIVDTKALQYNVLNEYMFFLKKHYPFFNFNNWDLPLKRNFAIWHGKKIGHKTILLLDDDVRFSGHLLTLHKMMHSVHQTAITGGYSIGEFDTSLTGAIAMRYGVNRPVFFSGNCLGINLSKFSPYFPYIYNEDWLSILPAILRRDASLVGPVEQLPRRVICAKDTAEFQEFGEIIADELYSHTGSWNKSKEFISYLDSLLSTSHWSSVLRDRFHWLSQMHKQAILKNRETDIVILDAAIYRCREIKTIDIVNFVNDWKVEYSDWTAKL